MRLRCQAECHESQRNQAYQQLALENPALNSQVVLLECFEVELTANLGSLAQQHHELQSQEFQA